MGLLNEEQRKTVAEAIASVERGTDAEVVTVLARQADDYRYIPTLWAAIAALLAPLLLGITPLWLSSYELLLAQWGVFIGLALLLRIPALMIRLIPKPVRYWRAANLARRQFLENNLHHTGGETGLLIFVSEAERYVEIIADRGISQHISDDQWREIVAAFTARVKAGEVLQGFLDCIESCGSLLQRHLPATRQKDELPNHLVILD